MAPYKVIQVFKYSKDIIIREMCNGTMVDGGLRRYFKATICGWTNFKFVTNTLKPQQLFEKVRPLCMELREKIKADENALNTIQTVFTID